MEPKGDTYFVHVRVEGSQMADRTIDKMWLVKHLEIIRQSVVEDMKVVKVSVVLCEYQSVWSSPGDFWCPQDNVDSTDIGSLMGHFQTVFFSVQTVKSLLNWVHIYISMYASFYL